MTFDIDIRDLRYFEVIAELQHIGRASERLHRSQPALTSAIRRLEDAYGAPLFERAGRGIRLAPAGHVLLKWAQRMRFDVEDSRREIADLEKGLSGQVRIGIAPTAAQFLLPSAARKLIAEAPEVSLKTVVGLYDRIKPLLQSGQLDMMVGTDIGRDPEFISRYLIEDQIVVAASAEHELFKKNVKLADLLNYRWVLQPAGAPTRDWLDQTFDRKKLPRPVVQVEASMLLILPALISETGLLSFISRHHLGAGTPLKEVQLKETTMHRRLVVTYRRNSYLSPAALKLIEIFENL